MKGDCNLTVPINKGTVALDSYKFVPQSKKECHSYQMTIRGAES